MKVLGIIAEYNPFHNGHAYQIQQAKTAFGADYVIIAMSGNYVQRGTPALLDKFTRTKMALSGGADLVFELPSLWSCASAEYFATAGITLLEKTGIVDAVSFGCETDAPYLLKAAGDLLAKEPPLFKQYLNDSLKQGHSFPVARETALVKFFSHSKCLQTEDLSGLAHDALLKKLPDIYGSPNNILALEYYKALALRMSNITPVPILRSGSGYHDTQLLHSFCSATALRSKLLGSKTIDRSFLSDYVPEDTAHILSSPDKVFLSEDDFSDALFYKLWSNASIGFESYGDCTKDLSNRIRNLLPSFTGFSDFCIQMKRKETTYTRISRMFLHILLDMKNQDYVTGRDMDYIPYLRLLGFRHSAKELLGKVKHNSPVPLLSKASAGFCLLPPQGKKMLQQDIDSSNLYYGIQNIKSSLPQKQEFQREIIRLP